MSVQPEETEKRHRRRSTREMAGKFENLINREKAEVKYSKSKVVRPEHLKRSYKARYGRVVKNQSHASRGGKTTYSSSTLPHPLPYYDRASYEYNTIPTTMPEKVFHSHDIPSTSRYDEKAPPNDDASRKMQASETPCSDATAEEKSKDKVAGYWDGKRKDSENYLYDPDHDAYVPEAALSDGEAVRRSVLTEQESTPSCIACHSGEGDCTVM
mmetsp:Transcript_12173/g.18167  ORF Transcript_12173/g.18167 Transcript_12173/m.18167 type:complete len:213 (-) Transcript_12173:73-711(-)